MPTCHRTVPQPATEDSDFRQAIGRADAVARMVYRAEVTEIDRLQKRILEISAGEAPYDVFICYKETDEFGDRTPDSVLGQEIYDALTAKGWKVFFSRITLEDKLGQEYEPYIYAALSSARVMLAVGTRFEYYDAVWVRNEWSRFLAMMRENREKTLIPCYRDLDAYDMPREFKNLQGLDMSKLGWIQDLTRGVGKILGVQSASAPAAQITSALTQRASIFLLDGTFEKALEYYDRALDENPTDAEAYLGKLLASHRLNSIESAENMAIFDLDTSADFRHAAGFATPALAQKLHRLQEGNRLRVNRWKLKTMVRELLFQRAYQELKTKGGILRATQALNQISASRHELNCLT